jgi:bacterioferritin (cytochrome b1)
MSDTPAVHTYRNRQFDSELAMILVLLDEYRCVEDFAAQYLTAWRGVVRDPRVRGGLRTICGRERAHADALAARLRELGGEPRCEMPAERLPDVAFYASPEHSDAAKMERTAQRLSPPEKVIGPIMAAIEQIHHDTDSRELLLTILDDERASIRWVIDSWESMRQVRDG